MDAYNGNEATRAADVTRALIKAKLAISSADNDLGKLHAIRDSRAELERVGDDGSDAIDELSNYAISVGLNPDDVQTALAHGLDLFLNEPGKAVSAVSFPTWGVVINKFKGLWGFCQKRRNPLTN